MKKLLLLLFLMPNLVMAEEKILPVAEYTASNTDWQSNLYEILYVACRCGFAYSSAHHELIERVGEEGVKEDLHEKGLAIAMNAVDYIEDMYGDIAYYDIGSLKFTVEQIAEFYDVEAANNYIGKNQFKGIIGMDLKTCESYDAFFDGLVQRAV